MPEKHKKFVLIDGNALVHRGFHALPPTMKTADGKLTNGVYGFTSMLLNTLEKIEPACIAVTFDRKKPTFRHKEFKDYKAKRVKAPQELYDQFPLVKKVVRAFNIPIYEKDGFEADDLLGTLSVKIPKQSEILDVVIVTGDLDTLQLINDRVSVFTLKKGFTDTVTYDKAAVRKRFGLDPEQLVDMKALAGDQSDNIPGVAGIGEKGAVELVKKFGTVEKIYEALEKEDPRLEKRYVNKLKGSKSDAMMSKKLVHIKKDVQIGLDLSSCRVHDFNPEKVADVFKQLGFRSLMDRIPGRNDPKPTTARGRGPATAVETQNLKSRRGYNSIFKESELKRLIDSIKKEGEFVFDTETTGLDPMKASLVGISICLKKGTAFYIPMKHEYSDETSTILSRADQKDNLMACENQLDKALVLKHLKPFFQSASIKKIGHNLKFDTMIMENEGVETKGIYFDTMIASYVLDPGTRGNSLDKLAFREFGYEMMPIEKLIGKGKDEITFDKVPVGKATFYACEDADYTMRLYPVLKEKLEKLSEEQKKDKFPKTKKDLDFVFEKMEIPLIEVLATMQREGVKIDVKFIEKFLKNIEKRIEGLTDKIYDEAGKEFNINSTQQLKEILFKKLKLPTKDLRTTKTGVSTAAGELEKLKDEHSIVKHILEYRELTKLKNTYLDTLPKLVNEKTGRLHTTFNQVVTATGRLSSSDPNLQNIPIRTPEGKKLRKAFVSDKEFKILSLDYSQIDLRVMAHYSEDPGLIAAFKKTKDIHSETAAKIFGVKPSQVLPGMRRVAKTVNFGVMYGMSPFGLSETLGIERDRAKHYITTYFNKYMKVKEYIETVLEFARDKGYVETMFGRRRYLPEINASNYAVRSGAERMAINMPIQGTSADLIKLAMVEVQKLIDSKWSNHARMLLQVHDELVFEVRESRLKEFAKQVRKIMEDVVDLKVPVNVDIEVGENWEELEEIRI